MKDSDTLQLFLKSITLIGYLVFWMKTIVDVPHILEHLLRKPHRTYWVLKLSYCMKLQPGSIFMPFCRYRYYRMNIKRLCSNPCLCLILYLNLLLYFIFKLILLFMND